MAPPFAFRLRLFFQQLPPLTLTDTAISASRNEKRTRHRTENPNENAGPDYANSNTNPLSPFTLPTYCHPVLYIVPKGVVAACAPARGVAVRVRQHTALPAESAAAAALELVARAP